MDKLPDKVNEAKKQGIKIIKLFAHDENKEYEFYFRKPTKIEFKMNFDLLVSNSMQANQKGKAFSLVSHMENAIKKQLLYPELETLSLFLDENPSYIVEFYNTIFGEVEKKLDFLSTEI